MTVDPKVWGNLPPDLTLEIHKRLPLREFYQLREVCKNWNLVARERRCVTDPIRKPYFLLIHEGSEEYEYEHYLHGILTYHITSGCWRWKNLHGISFSTKSLYKPFSVKGLTFSHFSRDSHRVFDAHTKRRYIIPTAPYITKNSRALGMTVDTSVMPHTFKVIIGSLDTGTQIYDSVTKVWERTSSLLVPCQKPSFKTCLHCGDHMYIWSQLDQILVYSLKNDTWSTLEPPPRIPHDSTWRALGSWQGRIFTVACDEGGGLLDDGEKLDPLVEVWELLVEKKRWHFFARMPSELEAWLKPPRIQNYEELRVYASFCDEHVLVYSWVPERGRAYRFVLYNLASKKWEKVEAPNNSVSIYSDSEEDTKDWEDHDAVDEESLIALEDLECMLAFALVMRMSFR